MPPFDFQPNDLHRLNRLVFSLRRAGDAVSGAHKVHRSGEGVDFLDFRPYSPGDDIRRVDWTIFGRTRQLFIRLSEASRQLGVTLLLDSSRSMLFGRGLSKLQQAQRLACGLAFIALQGGDRVHVAHFSSGVDDAIGPLTGRRSLPAIVEFLTKMESGGPSDLWSAVGELRKQRRHRGLVIVLSDFLSMTECEKALRFLLHGGGRFLAIQVLDELDLDPLQRGRFRLRDSETGQQLDITLHAGLLEAMQREFEKRRVALETFCRRAGQDYLAAKTSDSYVELICHALRQKAVLR